LASLIFDFRLRAMAAFKASPSSVGPLVVRFAGTGGTALLHITVRGCVTVMLKSVLRYEVSTSGSFSRDHNAQYCKCRYNSRRMNLHATFYLHQTSRC
jgi:hypothetical protein